MDEPASKEARHGSPAFPCAIYDSGPGSGRCVLYSHWHEEAEFFLLNKGQVTFFRDGQTIDLQAGEAVFIHRGEVHAAYARQDRVCGFSALVFSLDIMAWDHLGDSLHQYWQPFLRGDCRISPKFSAETDWGRAILSQLAVMIDSQRQGDPGHELALLAGLYQIFSLLIRHGQLVPALPKSLSVQASRLELLKQVLGFMHDNHTTKLSVAQIAAVAHMSIYHFSRYFKKMTGSTPLEYLVKYRIDQAERLLITSERKIMDIALSVGFETTSHFIKTFRKFKQASPAEYRKAQRHRQSPA